MNVIELYHLTKWVENEIVEKGLVGKYDALHTRLNDNAQSGQPQDPFEEEKNSLMDVLGEINLLSLTKDQISFLENLNILPALGKNGIKQIEDILFRNALDIATSSEKINKIGEELREGLGKIKSISKGLEGYADGINEDDSGKTLIRVSFLDNASIGNVVDFKAWGNKWHEIGRGISMAHNLPPEDVKIIGATKGSVILELMAAYVITNMISDIVLKILEVVKKIKDIQEGIRKIENLDLKNEKIIQDLLKEIENVEVSAVEEITEEQKKKLKGDQLDGEKITALTKAVECLLEFAKKGGDMDFVLPKQQEASDDENPPQDQLAEVRENTNKIRMIKEELKLIEHDNAEEEEKGEGGEQGEANA